jgi:hypothetical protein
MPNVKTVSIFEFKLCTKVGNTVFLFLSQRGNKSGKVGAIRIYLPRQFLNFKIFFYASKER